MSNHKYERGRPYKISHDTQQRAYAHIPKEPLRELGWHIGEVRVKYSVEGSRLVLERVEDESRSR